MVDTADSTESEQLSKLWFKPILIILAVLTFVVFTALLLAWFICRSDQRNRKQMSDLDALDTYKQGISPVFCLLSGVVLTILVFFWWCGFFAFNAMLRHDIRFLYIYFLACVYC